jgi:hypothetical protein
LKQFQLPIIQDFLFVFRMDMRSVEAKPSVQESRGIFQLIDEIEAAVDKLMERQE